jgi:outer membrane receptor protein involved in Fe transport
VNDTSGGDLLQNKFVGVYDEVDLITYHGELVIQPSPKLSISLDGKYFDYTMLAELKPWHKPDFRIGLDAAYIFNKKLTVQGGFNVIGNRWVKNTYLTEGMEKLKPFVDLNLKVNYSYSKALTIFADLYNIADRSYMIWNQYPAQRFNFIFGLSYKL